VGVSGELAADLHGSLVAELAAYLGLPEGEVAERCAAGASALAAAWAAAAPDGPDAVAAFYRGGDTYLFELTRWHALADDESALVQVVALEQALAHGCRTALDFGSGIGALGLLLARHGLAVTLAEVNPALQAYARWRFARRGLAATFLDPDDAPLPAGAFDLVAAIDVLEHLPDPGAALARLAAALRPGGVLVVHAPDAPDPLRPMHLWHDPARLYAALPAAGLWLERAEAGALVLRRGDGPRYRLNAGLELRATSEGAALLSRTPLMAFKLNRCGATVLAHLHDGDSALDVAARCPGLGLPELTGFLDGLARRRLLVRAPGAGAWPAVSVVVPAHGRHAQTRACVESLLALDYPGGAPEIIVVDDASRPPLAEALAGLPVRLVRNEASAGPSAARNRGAALAGGAIVAFTDNDCEVSPGWLRALVPYLDDPGVGFVGGRVVGPPEGGAIMAFEAVRSSLDMGPGPGEVGIGEAIPYMPSCNLLARRELLARLGGFAADMPIGEDVDLIWRGRRLGARAWYAPEGAVTHHHRARLGAFLRRRAFYARSEVDLLRRHPGSRRQMQLPATVLLLLGALAAAFAAPPLALALALAALALLAAELAAKGRQLRALGLGLGAGELLRAAVRGHGAALYHLGANVLRYYSLPLLAAALWWPPLLAPLLAAALAPPLLDHRRLRPALPAWRFVALFWLELTAYQLGIWLGCLRWRTALPLLPRLRWAR
jgi:mycofactocin system glycosyltransferase